MASHSGVPTAMIQNQVLFDFFPDLPQKWLKRKVESVVLLNTRTFTSWEQRPYLFRFRNTRPITGTEPFMYQNLTISPVIGPDGNVNKICLMIYDVTDKIGRASCRERVERAWRGDVIDQANRWTGKD